MDVIHKLFRRQGDLAREQVRRGGFLYFEDVNRDVKAALEGVSPEARKAFALACAQRVMHHHLELPEDQQRAFTVSLVPLLKTVASGLRGEDPLAAPKVKARVDRILYFSEKEDNYEDVDEDAAAAALYAAQCYLGDGVKCAMIAASRAVDAAFVVAGRDLNLEPNNFIWDPTAEPMPLAREAMHPAVQEELQRQIDDVEYLKRNDDAQDFVARVTEYTSVLTMERTGAHSHPA